MMKYLYYKKARNNVTKLLRSAETQYWKDQFANANKSRQFWKTVNSVNDRQYSCRIGPLKDHNDSEVLDDGLKAKLFNQILRKYRKRNC